MEQKSEIIVYQPNDMLNLEVRVENDSVWLTQSQMSELFQRDRSVITKHINNVFKEQELIKESNVQKMHIANSDKPVQFYSLEVIISVGYRVSHTVSLSTGTSSLMSLSFVSKITNSLFIILLLLL